MPGFRCPTDQGACVKVTSCVTLDGSLARLSPGFLIWKKGKSSPTPEEL